MSLKATENRIPPTRGLVLTHNERGDAFELTDLKRWIRLNRVVFKAEKIDLLIQDENVDSLIGLIDYVESLDARASLRSNCESEPPDLQALKEAGLFDIFLTPTRPTHSGFESWLAAAKDAGLPVRIQLQLQLHKALHPPAYAQRYKDAGVNVVNIAAFDPFAPSQGCTSRHQSERNIETLTALARELEQHKIECNILRIPFCLIQPDLWERIVTLPQFYLDHQQYRRDAYELARTMRERGPIFGGKVLSILLGKYTLFNDPIDDKLLPWLLESPWLRARVVAWHKLTRHLRLTRAVPKPQKEDEETHEKFLEQKKRETIRELGPHCGICSHRHICDHESTELSHALSGMQAAPIDGEVAMYPLQFAMKQKKYYDAIDEARLTLDTNSIELAATANDVIGNTAPDLEIDSFDYNIEGQWGHQLPGGLRWHGFTNTEKVSTPLSTLDPPFTLSVVFGGGIAEYIGFSFGRDCRLVCPMEAYRHRLVLHVEADGSYVLLRDGKPVTPTIFEGSYYTPVRLGSQLQPRITVWNIDHSLVTQNVALWSEQLREKTEERPVKFSIVTVCVRYARRLQAALQSIAHQQGIDLSDIEIVIAYVPEVDSTEDILDSFQLAHPDLRIRRSTFTEGNAGAKGFIINETLEKARGEWVMLLDADTLIPPNMLSEILSHADEGDFIVPDGRKLLTRETTAKVLLGDIKPWECWDDLLKGAGEFRYREMEGVPIGFCQIVRRACFDKVKYYEVDHFEGADWQFSIDMRNEFGKEIRLSGVPVLHLDHGGSKWYGTARHF